MPAFSITSRSTPSAISPRAGVRPAAIAGPILRVPIAIGCWFSMEDALTQAGIRLRHVELGGQVRVLADPDLAVVDAGDQHALGRADVEDHPAVGPHRTAERAREPDRVAEQGTN